MKAPQVQFKRVTYTPTPADFDMLIETERPHPAGGVCRVWESHRMHGGFLLLSDRKQRETLRGMFKPSFLKVIAYRLPSFGPPKIVKQTKPRTKNTKP